MSPFYPRLAFAGLVLATMTAPFFLQAQDADSRDRIPVILDTDIGDDMDDSWALVMLLKSPRFDVRLITTTQGLGTQRATIVAKYLTIAGRTDIPIGIGSEDDFKTGYKLKKWVGDFKLSDYHGKVRTDGVQALLDVINGSPEPVTVIAIGPLGTLGAALRKDPGIAPKTNLTGMQGSLRTGYGNASGPTPEYNVYSDIPDAKLVLAAPWKSIAITPLDTAGSVHLSGEDYQRVKRSPDPVLRALIASCMSYLKVDDAETISQSGTNFDTVGVYLSDPQNRPLLKFEKLKITVTDTGLTLVSPIGRAMDVATDWKDRDAYNEHLTKVLTGK